MAGDLADAVEMEVLAREAVGRSSLRRLRKGSWLARILTRAHGSENHSARSISGKCWIFPLFGGHSSAKLSLFTFSTSKSPSRANASTHLPPRWRTRSRGRSAPDGAQFLEEFASFGRLGILVGAVLAL